MRNKQIDELLEPAIQVVEEHLKNKEKGIVDKEYESATSSFGGTLTQCGPLPTLALYMKTTGSSDTDKVKLAYCLLKLVHQQGGFTNTTLQPVSDNENAYQKKAKEWMEAVIEEGRNDERLFEERLGNAVVALKLALRTFQLKKSKQ